MMDTSRRMFVAAASAVGILTNFVKAAAASTGKPALLGGPKIRDNAFPSWPITDRLEEDGLMETLRNGNWFRGDGKHVSEFEQAYRQLTGARNCLATANGTSALYVSMNGIGIEPGDEVVVPPYTFSATVNAVLRQYALPIFVDTDADTFQIDARKMEAALSPRTKAMMPVHLGGSA